MWNRSPLRTVMLNNGRLIYLLSLLVKYIFEKKENLSATVLKNIDHKRSWNTSCYISLHNWQMNRIVKVWLSVKY